MEMVYSNRVLQLDAKVEHNGHASVTGLCCYPQFLYMASSACTAGPVSPIDRYHTSL